jgi:hypothetical protein
MGLVSITRKGKRLVSILSGPQRFLSPTSIFYSMDTGGSFPKGKDLERQANAEVK